MSGSGTTTSGSTAGTWRTGRAAASDVLRGLLAACVLLLVWRHWLPLLGALGFGVATFGAFFVSTTGGGLFGVHEQWTGAPIWLSAISETAAILLALALLVVERPRRR